MPKRSHNSLIAAGVMQSPGFEPDLGFFLYFSLSLSWSFLFPLSVNFQIKVKECQNIVGVTKLSSCREINDNMVSDFVNTSVISEMQTKPSWILKLSLSCFPYLSVCFLAVSTHKQHWRWLDWPLSFRKKKQQHPRNTRELLSVQIFTWWFSISSTLLQRGAGVLFCGSALLMGLEPPICKPSY